MARAFEEIFRTFDDLDPALQWCEDRLLARAACPRSPDISIAVTQYALLDGLSREEVAVVQGFFERRTYEPGDVIIRAGDPARELFLLSRGLVSVFLPLENGARKRLATFSPGMAFGEMAIIDRAPRSATITADTRGLLRPAQPRAPHRARRHASENQNPPPRKPQPRPLPEAAKSEPRDRAAGLRRCRRSAAESSRHRLGFPTGGGVSFPHEHHRKLQRRHAETHAQLHRME